MLTALQPDADTLFSFGSPQPFVPLYAVLLGQGGHIFMNVICILALWLVSRISTLSRYQLTYRSSEHYNRHSRGLPPRLCRSP